MGINLAARRPERELFGHDVHESLLPQRQHMSAAQVDQKLGRLGITHRPQKVGGLAGMERLRLGQGSEGTGQKRRNLSARRRRHRQTHLEPAPDGPVEQLGMIGGGDDDDGTG